MQKTSYNFQKPGESTLKEVITEKDSRDATNGSKFHLGREGRSIVIDFFSRDVITLKMRIRYFKFSIQTEGLST